MAPFSSSEIRWDLSRLFKGPDDPAIERDRLEVERRLAEFEKYRGTISGSDASHLARVLEEAEQTAIIWQRLTTYAHLLACTDEDDRKRVEFRERFDELTRRWQARRVFFDLEIQKIADDRLPGLLADPALAPYRHYVRYQKTLAPHTLSEKEEQVILKKNVAGKDALVRFREEFAAKMDFGRLRVDGEEREMSESELRALLRQPDAALREAAANRLYETYGRHAEIYHFLYSNIVKDYGIEREMRGFARPIDVENVQNEIPYEVVENAIAAMRRHLDLVHDFFRFKARALGLPRLRTCDRLAPITKGRPKPIVWTEGRRLLEEALGGFDREFAHFAGLLFGERRIDAAVHRGKRGGAFCSPVPEDDSFVFVNYTDDADSALTTAHELGHAVHNALARRSQRYFQAYGMSKVIAETASEFFEALLTDHLIETERDPVLERYLLGHEIDGFLGTVNRQLMFTEFELAAHAEAANGPVGENALSEHWERISREHYGPHVDLMPGERIGWALVPHFFFNPFYCVSYALSHVVVLALYERYRERGTAFVPGYRALLAAGWSGTPEELLGNAGIDLRDPAVFEAAYRYLARRIERLEKLVPLRT